MMCLRGRRWRLTVSLQTARLIEVLDLPLSDPLLLVVTRGVPSKLGELGDEVCGCGCSRMRKGESGRMAALSQGSMHRAARGRGTTSEGRRTLDDSCTIDCGMAESARDTSVSA